MKAPNEDMLTAAIQYAEMGYRVFPCIAGSKRPQTKHGFKNATLNVGDIESFWDHGANANIGIPTHGLLVVDIDGDKNPWPGSIERSEDLARAPMALTPGGGRHYFFRQPAGKEWKNTTSQIAEKVDTRANGGYVIAPPSIVEGKSYRWAEGMELDVERDQLPEPPTWLMEILDGLSLKSSPTGAHTGPPGANNWNSGNMIPSGQRNDALLRLAGNMRRVGMSQEEIFAAIERVNLDRCNPPLESKEVQKIAASVMRYEPSQKLVAYAENHSDQDRDKANPPFLTAGDLCEQNESMRPPIIRGLLREGETMNVIAAPKTGKSWLVLNLSLSVVTGLNWLGFKTEPGNVLLIDNELHPETLADRIPRVAGAMKLPKRTWKDSLHVKSLRGCLEDLFRMESYFQSIPVGKFKLIVLDAFYRFMPRGMDENDNGTMANLYNLIDRYAAQLQTGFVLIHHTTKGLQSAKSVTDVGAGAGSQSRAADCHFILRPHQEDDCLSVDAVARSWPPPDSFVIRRDFPLWIPDFSLDPCDLKKPYQRSKKKDEAEDDDKPGWTPDSFVRRFVTDEAKTKASLFAEANEEDLSDYMAGKLLRKAEALGLIHRWHLGGNRPGFATKAQPKQGDETHA